jgi:hypothetical protein
MILAFVLLFNLLLIFIIYKFVKTHKQNKNKTNPTQMNKESVDNYYEINEQTIYNEINYDELNCDENYDDIHAENSRYYTEVLADNEIIEQNDIQPEYTPMNASKHNII